MLLGRKATTNKPTHPYSHRPQTYPTTTLSRTLSHLTTNIYSHAPCQHVLASRHLPSNNPCAHQHAHLAVQCTLIKHPYLIQIPYTPISTRSLFPYITPIHHSQPKPNSPAPTLLPSHHPHTHYHTPLSHHLDILQQKP